MAAEVASLEELKDFKRCYAELDAGPRRGEAPRLHDSFALALEDALARLSPNLFSTRSVQ